MPIDEILFEAEEHMDMTAIYLAMERKIPIIVFNLKKSGNIARAVAGEHIGTLITIE